LQDTLVTEFIVVDSHNGLCYDFHLRLLVRHKGDRGTVRPALELTKDEPGAHPLNCDTEGEKPCPLLIS
jgi:hypothetical protein